MSLNTESDLQNVKVYIPVPQENKPQNGFSSFTLEQKKKQNPNLRESWGNGLEFLLSCIAMAVGLGNVWRFPYIAMKNGGGAFVIPYLIVLVLVGKPGYFMEMIIGQFSSRGTVKVYDAVPGMRGVGIGQTLCIAAVATYYSSIMAINLRYLFYSFTGIPWGKCDPAWNVSCYPSDGSGNQSLITEGTQSSAEIFFNRVVLFAKDSIDDGIGMPNWTLVAFLVLSSAIVFSILCRGIRSFGKAGYVTGVVPFIFLIVFLVKVLSLDGAWDGIKFFFTPKWEDILKPSVWYEACTQVFFTLNVFFVNVIMCASYNKFEHNIYRDSNIVTTLDTFTSLLVGSITFGIVGHLGKELGIEDLSKVLKGGPTLVFVTYPEVISKFKTVPTLFAIMFFLMLYILALGSFLAVAASIITVIKEQFTFFKHWQATLIVAVYASIFGCVYLTPGGSAMLGLIDHYAANSVIFVLAVLEIYTFCYIYGVERLCKDVKFMLDFYPGKFWRICWKYVTPIIMTLIACYALWNYETPTYGKNQQYPVGYHVLGWFIAGLGLIWVPIIAIVRIIQQEGTLTEKIQAAFKPTPEWGPKRPQKRADYEAYLERLN